MVQVVMVLYLDIQRSKVSVGSVHTARHLAQRLKNQLLGLACAGAAILTDSSTLEAVRCRRSITRLCRVPW